LAETAANFIGCLPAVFWVLYSLSNTMFDGPPVVWHFTALELVYVLMLPSLVILLFQWRDVALRGPAAYTLFVGWVALGLLWSDPSGNVDVAKRLFIYGLLALTAAQVIAAGRVAQEAFAGGLMLIAGVLSLWTTWYALNTSFAYRSGVPTNPNLPASLIAPGLLVALGLYWSRTEVRYRTGILAFVLVALYATLLLGSRGLQIALLVAIGSLGWSLRPSFERVRPFVLGTLAVIVLAQTPTVALSVWNPLRGLAAEVLSQPAPLLQQPREVSNAFVRFNEAETGTLNFRLGPWVAGARYVVSSPRQFLFGGGIGTSQVVAHRAFTPFTSMHNSFLQVVIDFGLVGIVLFLAFQWQVVVALSRQAGWLPGAWLAIVLFWLIAGLSHPVTDTHPYWVCVGVAAAAAWTRPDGSERTLNLRRKAREA